MSDSGRHSDKDPSMETPDESEEDPSPNDSDMEAESEPEDETAWNRFRPRGWEPPEDDASDEEAFGFQRAEIEDSDADARPVANADIAGLFE